jgi:hypothetical protein
MRRAADLLGFETILISEGSSGEMSHHADDCGLEIQRDRGFRFPTVHVRPDDEAFNRSHVLPLLLSVTSKASRRGLAILR